MRLVLLGWLSLFCIGPVGAQAQVFIPDSSLVQEAYGISERAHKLRTSGEPDSALLLFREALRVFEEARDPLGRADCERNIGLSLKNELRYVEAADAYRRAVVIFETIPEQYPEIFATAKESCVQQLSWAYLNLAEVYSYLDNQQQVRIYMNRSQDLLEQHRQAFPLLAREALENQARFLDMMGRHDESVTAYLSVLSAIPPGSEPVYENRLLCKIAQVYGREAQRYEESVSWWLRAIDHNERYLGLNTSQMVPVYRELARCYINLGQLTEAEAALDEAWRLQSTGNSPLQAAILHFNEARLLHALGQHQAALASIDEGTRTFSFPPSSSLANIEVLRSMIYYKRYEETKELQFLSASEEWARKSLATLEGYEDRTFQRRSYGRFYRKPTEWLLHCLFARYETTSNEHLLTEIFQIMEQSRARQLRLGRHWEDQALLARFPSNMLDRKQQLERDRLRLLAERYQLERQAEPAERLYELADSLIVLEDGQAQLYAEFGPSFSQKIGAGDWQQVRQAMPNSAATIVYFTGDSTVFAMAITTAETALFQSRLTLENRQVLERLPDMVRRSNSPADSLGRLAFAAYQIYLGPLLDQLPPTIDRLNLVADGRLTKLPWAAFCTQAPPLSDFRNWPFLIQQYRLTYLPFAGDLLHNKDRDRQWGAVACFAPQYPAPSPTDQAPQLAQLMRSEFWPLPGAQREAKALSELYGSDARLFADGLTREQFIESLPDFTVAHLAMHALVNWEDPTQSYLLFPPQEPLTALELLRLQLETELMILSACFSGEGRWQAGEGVVSLAYALQQAGVRSVLSNSWAVADQFSADLMLRFHENLRAGQSLDQALAEAQLTYLAQAQPIRSAHPFYWAGYQIQGSTTAFAEGKSGGIWWIAGGIVLGLGLVYWRRSSRSEAA